LAGGERGRVGLYSNRVQGREELSRGDKKGEGTKEDIREGGREVKTNQRLG